MNTLNTIIKTSQKRLKLLTVLSLMWVLFGLQANAQNNHCDCEAKAFVPVTESQEENNEFVELSKGSEEVNTKAPYTIYSKRIAIWNDPTTLPKTKWKCKRYIRLPFRGRTCIEWKMYKKYYRRTATLMVTGGQITTQKIKKAVEASLKEAAIKGIIAGILSNGTAAKAVAVHEFKKSLRKKLRQHLINVKIDLRGGWTKWK